MEWADPLHDRSAQCDLLEWTEWSPWELGPSLHLPLTGEALSSGCGQSDLYEGKSTKSLRLVSVATLYLDLMNKHWAVGEEAD